MTKPNQTVAIESFRDLRVWQGSMDLVEQVYLLTAAFPRPELYGLASQMQRAAVSIPSNIAEGHTREHKAEYLQHVSIAQGSLAELQTQFEIAIRLNYIARDHAQQTLIQMTGLARQLYSLRNALIRPSGRRPSTPILQHPTPRTE